MENINLLLKEVAMQLNHWAEKQKGSTSFWSDHIKNLVLFFKKKERIGELSNIKNLENRERQLKWMKVELLSWWRKKTSQHLDKSRTILGSRNITVKVYNQEMPPWLSIQRVYLTVHVWNKIPFTHEVKMNLYQNECTIDWVLYMPGKASQGMKPSTWYVIFIVYSLGSIGYIIIC